MFRDTFVISLNKKAQRRETIQKELARMKLSSTWFCGMDGYKKDVRDMVKRLGLIHPDSFHYFTPGHLGCLFSHYSLWQQIYLDQANKSLEDAWILILEDDTRFHPSVTPEILAAIWASVPPDAKVVKFHSSNGYTDNHTLFSTDHSTYFLKQNKLTFSLMSYAIHTSVLKSLLMKVWTYHIDLFHTEGIYIVKRPEKSDLFVSRLYGNLPFFSHGICIPNNTLDSDTISTEVEKGETVEQAVSLPFSEKNPLKEGVNSVHLYDLVSPSGTCHVFYEFNVANINKLKGQN